MRIGFFSSRMSFEPDSLTERGIGGSESALINLTREWKNRYPDDEIIIYNDNSGKYKKYNGCDWKTLLDFQLDVKNFNLDVFISLREPEVFYLPYIDSKLKILWSQDNMQEHSLQNLQKNKYGLENIDRIFVISSFAYNSLKEAFSGSKLTIVRNGYNPSWTIPFKEKPKKPIAVYTSTPFRGLDLLTNYWPIIYDKCGKENNIYPELWIFGGMSLYGQSEDPFIKLYSELKSQKGVRFYGSIPQKKLYEELQKAKVMLYPNTHTETGCMAVTEALANGLWVVTSEKGALPEQVKDDINGYLIPGDPYSSNYRDAFILDAVTSLIDDSIIPDNSENFGICTWAESAKLMRNEIEEVL